LYTRDAIIDISRYSTLARRIDGVVLTVDPLDSKKYALPADFVSEITVECPAEAYLEPRQAQIGRKFRSSILVPTFYRIDGAFIYLNAPAGAQEVKISYYGLHPYPASVADTTFVLTIPQRDMELVRLYVVGRVMSWMRQQQSKLDRFKVAGGARDDNPLFPETNNNERTYEAALYERFPTGAVLLFRPKSR